MVAARAENGPVLDPDAVSVVDLEEWASEFDKVLTRIEPLFVHENSLRHAGQYLRGLLAPIERKNGWTIAEYVGEKEPKAMQRFLNLALWDADALRDLVCDYAIEHLNDPRGILVADPTGFAKKGKKSAGVQRQYSGTLGRVDNCQIGTFLAYVTTGRDRVLIDRELYVPEDSWFGDPARCAEAGIPDDLTFATRPKQVMAMIERARWSELLFEWFTADEEFGQNPGLRAYLEEAEIAYVMAVPKDTAFTDHTGRQGAINQRAARLAANDWQRRARGIGSKGFRVYDWALINSDDPEHQYMIRRSIDDGELAFYHCFNPRREGFGELVRVAGARWPIEECFEAAKGGVGLDDYQVRLYHAWYRHVTLAMLAHAFLTVCARKHKNKKGSPDPLLKDLKTQDQQ
ncbi:IS701 family transposase [Rhodococcus sp. DK17]|uniref:IS701 family transposase n=1 Tax=Rhodococcus TaxID=1827 RepID=UPI0026A1656A